MHGLHQQGRLGEFLGVVEPENVMQNLETGLTVHQIGGHVYLQVHPIHTNMLFKYITVRVI